MEFELFRNIHFIYLTKVISSLKCSSLGINKGYTIVVFIGIITILDQYKVVGSTGCHFTHVFDWWCQVIDNTYADT